MSESIEKVDEVAEVKVVAEVAEVEVAEVEVVAEVAEVTEVEVAEIEVAEVAVVAKVVENITSEYSEVKDFFETNSSEKSDSSDSSEKHDSSESSDSSEKHDSSESSESNEKHDSSESSDSSDSSENNGNENISRIFYENDGVDYSEYAEEFLENESIYYEFIKSYANKQKVYLFIREKDVLKAGAFLDEMGYVFQFMRGEASSVEFPSIQSWVDDYYGKQQNVDVVLNNVYIGDDYVPLWKILPDAMEEDNAERKIIDQIIQKNEEVHDISSITLMVMMFWLLITIIFMLLFILLLVTSFK